jgi:hypothetical protein
MTALEELGGDDVEPQKPPAKQSKPSLTDVKAARLAAGLEADSVSQISLLEFGKEVVDLAPDEIAKLLAKIEVIRKDTNPPI